jgi:protein SCO1/2
MLSVAMLAGCTLFAEEPGEDEPIPISRPSQGTQITPRKVEDFTLTNQDGEPFTLSDVRGKPVLLYFGYTFCPDICPTSLAEFVRVKRGLEQDDAGKGDQVAFIFISVDGERDTPEVIKSYLAAFDPDFIGLTGDEQDIRRIGVDYGTFFEKNYDVEGTSADYLVDHSAASYLLDQEGKLTTIYGYGTPPEVIIEDLRAMLDSDEPDSDEPDSDEPDSDE